MRCVAHRNRPHELEAHWRNKKLIIKAENNLDHYKYYMPPRTKFNLTAYSFIHYVSGKWYIAKDEESIFCLT